MDIKPGWKTSEFWLALGSVVIMVLVAAGVVGPGEADEISDLLGPFVGGVLPVVLYIWSRAQVKSA